MVKFKLVVLTAFMAIFLVSCATPAKSKKERKASKAEAHYRIAEVHFASNELPAALKELDNSTKADPQNHEAYHLMALTFLKMDRSNDALINFKKAIKLKSDFTMAHFNLGYLYLSLERWDDAIIHNKIVLKDIYYGKPELAYNSLGWAYYNKGDYEVAIANYKKALEKNPQYSVVYNNLGLLYEKTSRLEAARKSMENAVKISPSHPDFYFNLGKVLIRMKDNESATEAFENTVLYSHEDSEMSRSAKEYLELLK